MDRKDKLKPSLTELETLAREAGKILRSGYEARPGMANHLEVNYKGTIDLVTDVDIQSEKYLIEIIRQRYPDHRIVSEESGVNQGGDCCIWYIDPIDGTVNFAHGIPFFSVSIAYAYHGQIELGVVFDPMRDECFSAEQGRGAWLNGSPIRANAAIDLDHSLLATGFAYDIRTNPDNNLNHHARFALRSQGVRRLGSAALDLCYVAAGRFDGYWELRLNSWDIAAGGLIAQEAGAVVTDMNGDPKYLEASLSIQTSILAGNPAIHARMLAILREV
jgi:myo-inositol-1(or 4)-monophosphatase